MILDKQSEAEEDVEISDTLSDEQRKALQLLTSGENIFLTGGAGSGKSFLIRHFMQKINLKTFPILASTGTAAVLLGGRTFHSFFGLGIMEGGVAATVRRATEDRKVLSRIKKIEGFIIDEISMISGDTLVAAEMIAQKAKDTSLPWGGLQIIAVGDFAQLPPVSQNSVRDWCFLSSAWQKTDFLSFQLKLNQRVQEDYFLKVLQKIRWGFTDSEVFDFLQDRLTDHDADVAGTRLFPRRAQADSFNQTKLAQIPEEEVRIASIYIGSEKHTKILLKSAPVPETLVLKIGCQILFVQNDVQKRWVNGTRGTVTDIQPAHIKVKKENGREVTVEKASFSMQNAEGEIVASVIQFPLILAYATTIHKSQGATLDSIWCDLAHLWEPGQAYVALSRLRTPHGLHLLRWNSKSIIVDPQVKKFYQDLNFLDSDTTTL